MPLLFCLSSLLLVLFFREVQYFGAGGVIGVVKGLSHIMVSLSVLLLLVFGAGGMGWQRCSCSGRVSLLSIADRGCCARGSSCMVVTVSPVSTADVSQPAPQVGASVMDFAVACQVWPTMQQQPVVAGVACALRDGSRGSPPGWLAGNCPVLRV